MLRAPVELGAEWVRQWPAMVAGVGALALSLVLVYLYWDVRGRHARGTEIRARYAELQATQTKLMRANHEPVLRRAEWSEPEPDRLDVKLSNVGTGVARNLRLETRLTFENDVYGFRTETFPLYRVDGSAFDTQDADLRADETATFAAPLAVGLTAERFSDSVSPFSAAVEKLRYTGTDTARVEVDVRYENVLGEPSRKTTLKGVFRLSEGLGFADAMRLETADPADVRPRRRPSFSPFRFLEGTSAAPPTADVAFTVWPAASSNEYAVAAEVTLTAADVVKVKRGDRVVASFDADTETPRPILGDTADEPALTHGELLHVLAVREGTETEIDCFAAPDSIPRLFSEAERGDAVETATGG